MVQLHEGGVCRSVNINRVGFQAQLAAVHGDGFHFVQQYEGGTCLGVFGNGLSEQLGHRLLGFAHRGAGERVWFNFEIRDLFRREQARCLGGKPPGERRLAGSRFTHEHDDSVERDDRATHLRAQGKVQQCLAEQGILQVLGNMDRTPQFRMILWPQRPGNVDSFDVLPSAQNRSFRAPKLQLLRLFDNLTIHEYNSLTSGRFSNYCQRRRRLCQSPSRSSGIGCVSYAKIVVTRRKMSPQFWEYPALLLSSWRRAIEI